MSRTALTASSLPPTLLPSAVLLCSLTAATILAFLSWYFVPEDKWLRQTLLQSVAVEAEVQREHAE